MTEMSDAAVGQSGLQRGKIQIRAEDTAMGI